MPAIPYSHPAVRDLTWACFSTPMICCSALPTNTLLNDAPDNATLRLTSARQQWLTRLDTNPQPLINHLAGRPSHRLGLYFERLWQFFLHNDPALELIAHNLPVYENRRTLGEFDCLYYCYESRRHVHLELAVKYYLGYFGDGLNAAKKNTGSSRWHHWIGPNRRDRLDLKLKHLLNHQTRLSESDAGKRVLADRGIHTLQRQMEVKGYLFAPAGQPTPAPSGFHPEQKLNRWWRLADLPRGIHSGQRYRILSRLQWLSPTQVLNDALSGAALLSTLEAKTLTSPKLIAAVDKHGREIERFFVTGNSWPD